MASLTNLNYGVHPIQSGYLDADGAFRPTCGYRHPPLKSAVASAETFRRAVRLTADDLLADPAFRSFARAAAEKGRAFTADLLQWEKKDVVSAAVAVVRAEVDAERAEAARVAAEKKAAEDARLVREWPTRSAVFDAYAECEYRTCAQGHSTHVEFVTGRGCGRGPGASADTAKGDRYSSRCTYRRVTSHHEVRVRPDWLTRVAAVAAHFEGWLVLDAEPVGFLPNNAVVYELRVARQGAGTGLNVVTETATVEDGEWVELPKRAKLTRMPAAILADYLEERGVPTADVMPLRAEYVS